MASYEEISRQLDQAESTMRDAESRLGDFQSLRPALAELVGRAAGADGDVSIEWTAQGLSTLEIAPRAMRMPSMDLAAAIRAALGEAITDLRTQTRAALAAAGVGAASAMPLDDVRSQLTRMRENTMGAARQSAADLDRASRYRRDSGY